MNEIRNENAHTYLSKARLMRACILALRTDIVAGRRTRGHFHPFVTFEDCARPLRCLCCAFNLNLHKASCPVHVHYSIAFRSIRRQTIHEC